MCSSHPSRSVQPIKSFEWGFKPSGATGTTTHDVTQPKSFEWGFKTSDAQLPRM